MAKKLDQHSSSITSGERIRPVHISQFEDAFTGKEAYDINISGSLTVNGQNIADYLGSSTYNLTIDRNDIEWEDDWIKIPHTTTTNNQLVTINKLTANTGKGILNLTGMISYPASPTYSGQNIYSGFLLKDIQGILSKTSDFINFNIQYNITSDTKTKYSFKRNNVGPNVVSSHRKDSTGDTGNEFHALNMKYIFYGIYPEFSSSYVDTYYDPITNYGDPTTSFEPTYYELKDACLMMKPYTYAASSENDTNPNFLEIGSHGSNTAVLSHLTPALYTFLTNSIAVGAKNENDWQTPPQTTYGYGMEFFEITNRTYLNENYPNRAVTPYVSFQCWSDSERTTVWTENTSHAFIMEVYQPGDRIFINIPISSSTFGGTHSSEWTFLENPNSVKRTITNITSSGGYTKLILDGPIWDTQCNGNKYVWGYLPIGYSQGAASTQSPATIIVGAKMLKIKNETGVGWKLVREACRETAILTNGTSSTLYNISGSVSSIDVLSTSEFPTSASVININGYDFAYNSKTSSSFSGSLQTIVAPSGSEVKLKWDMWRGFGQIDVSSSIAYIENNYTKNDSTKNVIVSNLPKIPKFLEFSDMPDDAPVSVKQIKELLGL